MYDQGMNDPPSFIKNKTWADRHNDSIINILYKFFPKYIGTIKIATIEDDMMFGRDFIYVFKNGIGMSIGCRLRKYRYYFYKDFSIRYYKPNGAKTEINTIRTFGDYFFYGYVNDDDIIDKYFLIDLDNCRKHKLFDNETIIKYNWERNKPNKSDGIRALYIPFTDIMEIDKKNIIGYECGKDKKIQNEINKILNPKKEPKNPSII